MPRKIVVLDNDQISLCAIRELLRESGVSEDDMFFTTSPEGVKGFLTRHSQGDVILICDYELGNYSFGDEVITRMKKDFPSTRCLLVSGASVKDKAKAVGAEFLPKAHIELLPQTIQDLFP